MALIDKARQLGMSTGKAAHRLRTDLLFRFAVQQGHRCFHCGGELDRESFSIEHKVAWLHASDPVAVYFDLDNVAFSHLSCNSRVKRHPRAFADPAAREAARLERKRANGRKHYTPERRAERHRRTGR